MSVRANIEKLAWESDFFHRPIAKLIFDDLVGRELKDIDFDSFPLVQAKVAADDYDKMAQLAQWEFQFVEGEIDCQLHIKALERTIEQEMPGTLVYAQKEHIPALKAIASEVFHNSRFRMPWYSVQERADFYAKWVENAVLGLFDHHCLLLIQPDSEIILGFVSFRIEENNRVRIGLLASAGFGRGIGDQLMNGMINWCDSHHMKWLCVATQTSNLKALKLYLRHGAIINHIVYWFYRGVV